MIFLFYWIFGGVFFAILAFLRLRRIYKVRFSCLFTLTSIGCAIGATLTGQFWITHPGSICTNQSSYLFDPIISFLSCRFFSLFASVLLWAGVLIFLGCIFLLLSRTDEETWLGHLLHYFKQSREEIEE
jgi:hypothetical protein